jgi:hypothetical protein
MKGIKVTPVRLTIHVITTLGVTKIVNDIVKNNAVIETPGDQIKVFAGSLVIGTYVADVTIDYVEERMNEIAAWWESRKAEADS